MQRSVQHSASGLVITISTSTPEALHAQLLKGFSVAMRELLMKQPEIPEDVQAIASLTIIQQALTPGERELGIAYKK